MFHVGNIPTLDQEQFGDFRSCLGIFNNSTKLQKNRKKNRKEGLTWRLQPGPPAGPAQRRASELLVGQAGRQVPDGGRSVRHAAGRRPASPPRLVAGWMNSTSSREPPRHLHSPPTPLSRVPPPWPTPPPPCPRRSRAPRRPCVFSSCPGAPPPSTLSS